MTCGTTSKPDLAPQQVHARNKPLDRSGSGEHEEDALLHKVADLTIGYSGAELANLLNESAILAVRTTSRHCDILHSLTRPV